MIQWLDDLIEIAPLLDRIIKDGLSLTVFVGIAVFLLKRYRKRRPSQLDRIERKLDFFAERQGIVWDVSDSKSFLEASATKRKSPFTSRYWANTTARIVARFIKFLINQGRNVIMRNKLKSRKFWMAVVAAALVIANDGLDLGIDQDTVLTFAGLVVSWIIGESAVDATRLRKEATAGDDSPAIQPDERV